MRSWAEVCESAPGETVLSVQQLGTISHLGDALNRSSGEKARHVSHL